MDIFNVVIAPFAWLLKTLYTFTGSYGLALILFALLTKVILLYFSFKGKRGMMQTQRIQPKQQALQKQYGNDKQKYQEAVQKLYQEEGVSMTGGCLWSLLPFPILMALYGIITQPLTHMMGLAQAGVDRVSQALAALGVTLPQTTNYYQLQISSLLHDHFAAVQQAVPDLPLMDINYNFLGLNLAQTPTLAFNPLILIPILSGLSAYLSMVISMKINKQSGAQQTQNKIMGLLMPAMSLYFAFIMPAIMGVYWIAQNVFGLVQDYFLTKYYNKVFAVEDAKKAELEARRKAAEEAMKEEQRQRRAEAIEAKKQKRKPGQTVYKVKSKPPANKKELAGEDSE